MNQNTQPDYIALAMVIVLVLIVIVMVIRKWLSDKSTTDVDNITPDATETKTQTLAPGSAGHIKLNGVAPKTAAMAMAIVADKMGVPLNELRFISIKEVDE